MQKRGVSRLFVQFFCLTVPKNFIGEHFGVSENFGYRKIFCIREGGGYHVSRRKLLSHSTEKFCWGTLRCFRKFRVSQIFMHKKGISLNSSEKFLSHRTEKTSPGNHSVFQKISGREKNFMDKKGGGEEVGITIFR